MLCLLSGVCKHVDEVLIQNEKCTARVQLHITCIRPPTSMDGMQSRTHSSIILTMCSSPRCVTGQCDEQCMWKQYECIHEMVTQLLIQYGTAGGQSTCDSIPASQHSLCSCMLTGKKQHHNDALNSVLLEVHDSPLNIYLLVDNNPVQHLEPRTQMDDKSIKVLLQTQSQR